MKKQKKLWQKLKNESVVTVVNAEQYKQMQAILLQLQQSIRKFDYNPSQLLGHLGMCKNNGATRFIPVMTIEDFSVYYACVSSLQDYLCFELDGVYGGWRMRSNSSAASKTEVHGDYVFDGSLSREQWFKNWQSYSDLLEHECELAEDHTFFHVTDIANFYDSIDLFKLENLLKKHVPEWDGTIDVLIHFLKYWNRTVRGYDPASKGLPQEIVQDASRILANFYLRDLDVKFGSICTGKGLKYLRWADDITIIGNDKNLLEETVHQYSMELHKIGLNLNAPKTRCYSKRDIESYNCLDIMKKFKSKDTAQIDVGIEWFRTRISEGRGKCREDRIIRRLLTLLSEPSQKDIFYKAWKEWKNHENHKNWLRGFILSSGFDLIKIFDAGSLIKFFSLYSDPILGLKEVTQIILEKPYTSPKAEILFAIKKLKKKQNMKNRVVELDEFKNQILESASDSAIITKYCA